jgi:hypothetical protein
MIATWKNNGVWKTSDVWKKLSTETKQQLLGTYKEKKPLPKNPKNFEIDKEGGEE